MGKIKRRLIQFVLVLAVLALHVVPVVPSIIEVNHTCTLADAINAANNDSDSGGLCPPGGAATDTLILTDNVTLYDPLPAITTDIIVEGQGFAIERAADAEKRFTILNVDGFSGDGDLTVKNSTIRNGRRAMSVDGATVTILDSTLSGNSAYWNGGAIYNSYGTLTIDHSTLSENHSDREGGAIHSIHGGTVVITNSTISDNTAGAGGAISTGAFDDINRGSQADLTIESTTFSGNRGAAIYNLTGRIAVFDSTFVGNYGGAISNELGLVTVEGTTFSGNTGGALNNLSSMTVTNSTLSGNVAAYYGGGIQNWGAMTVTNSTVVGNSAGNYGGGIYNAAGELTLTNTVVAGNTDGGDCTVRPWVDFVDGGGNFDGDGSCPGAASIVPGVDFDITLADNGGTTRTHALLPDSVARDAAGECGLDTDQRGIPRNDGACDSGAFELLQGACCTDGPGTQSECVQTDQTVCEVSGGRFLGPGSACRSDIDCSALLVTMKEMSAEGVQRGVVVRWTTAQEVETVGFRVLRESIGRRDKHVQPVGQIISAAGSEVVGASYQLLDDSPLAARAIEYFIEDIDLFGRVTRHGPIPVERGARQSPPIRVEPRR